MDAKYVIEDGMYGKRILLKSAWDNSLITEFKRRKVKELYLNYVKGWTGDNLDFLSSVKFLVGFDLIDWSKLNISGIHELNDLRFLSLSTACKSEVNFVCFPNIEICFLNWRPRAKSIFDATSLKRLYLDQYKGQDTDLFSCLHSLEFLEVGNCPAKSLEGLGELSRLRCLGLYRFSKLPSLHGIERLSTLNQLQLSVSAKIDSLEKLETMRNLKHLIFENRGAVESLKPLEKLAKLESVLIYSKVRDKDLTPLKRLPNLKTAYVKFDNGYNCSVDEFPNKQIDGWETLTPLEYQSKDQGMILPPHLADIFGNSLS